jgi:hypothetical protein
MIAAVALFLIARPIARENEQPWPPGSPNERLGVATPALDGPDQVDLGPLVAVTEAGLSFERAPQDATGVEGGLRAYRERFSLLHPGEPAPREILLACAPDAKSGRAFAMLEVARRSGYDRAAFILETARTVIRPILGTVVLRDLSAARVSIGAGDGGPTGTVYVHSDDAPTCAQLAARVVALRKAGVPVVLVPGAAAP